VVFAWRGSRALAAVGEELGRVCRRCGSSDREFGLRMEWRLRPHGEPRDAWVECCLWCRALLCAGYCGAYRRWTQVYIGQEDVDD
jgi:hypothetical protein